MHDREGPDRLTLAAFGAAVLIGGSNFVAVKFSNAELAPMYGAAVRFTAAAIVFLLLGWALSLPLPRGRALLGSAVYGALNFGVAYGLLYFALLEISIGMSAVIMATVPLFTLILAVLHGQERFTTRESSAGFSRGRHRRTESELARGGRPVAVRIGRGAGSGRRGGIDRFWSRDFRVRTR